MVLVSCKAARYSRWSALPLLIAFSLVSLSSQHVLIKYSRPPLQPGEYCCEVNTSRLWKKNVQGLAQPDFSALERFFKYDFLLPEAQLYAGLTFYGSAHRLRQFTEHLAKGTKALKIEVIGDGVAKGLGARVIGTDDWFSIVNHWINSTAKSPVTAHNGGLRGAPSAYTELCMKHIVDPDVDLVFVEHSFSDGYVDFVNNNPVVMAIERLVRLLLDLPSKPAVVMVHAPVVHNDTFEAFYATSEDMEGVVSRYYNLPTVSARTALHQLAVVYPQPGWEWYRTYDEDHHPGNAGHKVIADLIVHLLQTAVVDLLLEPLTGAERTFFTRPMPTPLIENNLPPNTSRCFVGAELQPLAQQDSQGWVLVDEGERHRDLGGRGPEGRSCLHCRHEEQLVRGDRPAVPDTDIASKHRWGYVADKPGSVLRLKTNTLPPGKAPGSVADTTEVLFHFQATPGAAAASASGPTVALVHAMGVAAFECATGCTCARAEVDAHVPSHQGPLMQVHGLAVSQTAAECEIRVTVLDRTSSGGHRFKLSGMVVSDWNAPKGASQYHH